MRNYFSGSFPRQHRDVGAGGAKGAMPPQILADHVTLFQAWGGRECVRAGAVGARTRRSLGHHLLHPLILRLLVLCAPTVLRPRALQDAPAPADPNS